MKKQHFWRLATALAAIAATTSFHCGYAADLSPPTQAYRSERVTVEGANADAIGKECETILDRLEARYGKPTYWQTFPVRYKPYQGGSAAGYTSYVHPYVEEVVIYGDFDRSVGKVLDHELTHAFFFYYLRSNFDLLLNEGLAQNSEYGSRERLRTQVYARCANGEFVSLARLYGSNRYDASLLIYTQGFSVVDMLIARGGSRWFAQFMLDLTHGCKDVDEALRRHYGYESLQALEQDWLEYVRNGQDRGRVRAIGKSLQRSK